MANRKVYYVDKDPTRTKYVMNKTTGQLMGRRVIRKGEKQDKILNIREKNSGRIFGFLPAGKTRLVKGTDKSRSYVRRLG